MVSFLGSFTVLFSVFFMGCTEDDSQQASSGSGEYIYAGTFEGEGSEGLYVYELNRENLSLRHIQTVTNRIGPNFQAIHPNKQYLYSVGDDPFTENEPFGTLSAYRINQDNGMLELINEQSVEGRNTAHVSVDPMGEFVYVSNYTEGNIVMFRILDDGSVTEAIDSQQHEGSSMNENRQNAPHVHQAVPSADGRFLYVSDLGIDKIMIYEIDREEGRLIPASTPWFESVPGSGPRHMALHPNGEFAYSNEELSVTVAALSVNQETGSLLQIQRLSMLPEDVEREDYMSGADIHVSPDGKYLYASVRGENLLAVYNIDPESGELTLVEHVSTEGDHPRNFTVDEKGEFAIVANRDSDHIVIFERNTQTGELSYTGTETEVPVAVCVTQLILE
jgi:6-phosphogluconolactonase